MRCLECSGYVELDLQCGNLQIYICSHCGAKIITNGDGATVEIISNGHVFIREAKMDVGGRLL